MLCMLERNVLSFCLHNISLSHYFILYFYHISLMIHCMPIYLYTYIPIHLYMYLPGIQNDVLKLWYRTYQRVMSMETLRSHLYSTPVPHYEEAQFTTMHATFSLVHVYPKLNEEVLTKANNMFVTLLQHFFQTNLQVMENGLIHPNCITYMLRCHSDTATVFSLCS